MTDADALIADYILREFRDEYDDASWKHMSYERVRERHIAGCDQARVLDSDARDSRYGCDTGCEYVRFTATISCPHGKPVEYKYGEFGDLAFILADLESSSSWRMK